MTLLSHDTQSIPAIGDEAAARRIIARKRRLASGLLAAMLGIFAVTWLYPHPGFWPGLLRAGSQAGIIGGLADWFAVVAIFRHPLGIPLPHTAVLPRSKDRIGRALGSFVEHSFLNEAVLIPRLRAARPAKRLAAWLSIPANARLVAGPIASALPEMTRAFDNPEFRNFLNRLVSEQLREIDFGPILGRSLEVLTHTGDADVLFERGIEVALAWLDRHRLDIDRLIQQRSKWWIPSALDRQIARNLLASATETLQAMRDRRSSTRRKFDEAFSELIQRLVHSHARSGDLITARDRLLDSPEVQAWLNAVWTEISEALVDDVTAPESRIRALLEKAVASLGRTLADDEPMQATIDALLERATERILAFRGEITRFMAEVIRTWDSETLAERLELVVGADLQYVRMNGTVVGCLVGFVMFTATSL